VLKNIRINITWLFGEKALLMLIGFTTMLCLARVMGPNNFGSLNYLLAIIALIAPIVSLGLQSIVVRELINLPGEKDKIISTVIGFRTMGAVLGAFICLVFAFLDKSLSDVDVLSLYILAIGSVFNGLNELELWFQAKVAASIVAKMRTLVLTLFSVLKVVVVFNTDSVMAMATVFAIEQLVLGLGFLTMYYIDSGKLKISQFDWSYGVALLKQSIWLVLSGVAAVVYLKIDQVMLGQMVGRESVGVYAVAVRVSEVWYFFATAIVISVFPSLLSLRQKDLGKYYSRLQTICDLLLVSALMVAICVTLLAPLVIPVLFGEAYRDSALLLSIHVWAGAFVFMRALVSKWLIAEHLLKFSLISHGLGSVINITANYLLIPSFGGVGAAYATVLSYAVASYLTFWLHPSTIPIAKIMSRSLILPLTLGKRYW
jgi:O-antigen/teichoic acid export membrane protein